MIKRLEFWGGVMRQYLDSLSYLLDTGELCKNRTGIDTYSIFGYQMRFNLQHGFPAITTRKLAWRSVVGELLWFLEGSTDERRLAEITYEKPREELVGVKTIWTANADHQGKALGYINNPVRKELGPIYGRQWRAFNGENNRRGVDQIKLLCEELQQNPYSRRLIFSSWNPTIAFSWLIMISTDFSKASFGVIDPSVSIKIFKRLKSVLSPTRIFSTS